VEATEVSIHIWMDKQNVVTCMYGIPCSLSNIIWIKVENTI
jgi:hypothetical protein